jgi:hypothetical protein
MYLLLGTSCADLHCVHVFRDKYERQMHNCIHERRKQRLLCHEMDLQTISHTNSFANLGHFFALQEGYKARQCQCYQRKVICPHTTKSNKPACRDNTPQVEQTCGQIE